jgi:hypothetical protein
MLKEDTGLQKFNNCPSGSLYPRDLAQFARDRWKTVPEAASGDDLLPPEATLNEFFSACYHASMLREEERPVTFRAILAPSVLFSSDGRPPEGLQRLDFSTALPFNPNELRRLSVAADPERTLIGVEWDSNTDGGMRIWGLINSGTWWLRNVQGGRRVGAPLPPAPVVHVEAPGRIEVHKGYELVGKLYGGRISGSRVDLFQSQWLPVEFSQFRQTLMERHQATQNGKNDMLAPLEPSLPRMIAERMMKRVIAMLRAAHHGGTIIVISQDGDIRFVCQKRGRVTYWEQE